MKRPSFQFYPGDWLNDAALRSCSVGARGLWIEMICLMHQGSTYGYLKVNNKVILPPNLARMVGATLPEIEGWLQELSDAGVFSIDDDGAIFSRRMIRDEEIRQARAAGGIKGGNPSLKTQNGGSDKVGVKVNLPSNLQPTPSSSSSSSEINTPPTPPCRGGDACGESVDPNRVSEPTDQKPRPKPESRGTRLSSELELPDDWKIFCESERPDLLAGKLFQEFRDYWVAVPGAKGKKLDWFATWRNRVRSARSYEHGKNHHNHRTPTDNSAFGRIRAAVERERAAETVGKREAEINPKFMDIDGGSVRPPMGIELRR